MTSSLKVGLPILSAVATAPAAISAIICARRAWKGSGAIIAIPGRIAPIQVTSFGRLCGRLSDIVFKPQSGLQKLNSVPSVGSVALIFGLSFFLGLAFEESFAHGGPRRPGGIRTFPLLALLGGALYLFDSARAIAFTGGLLILGAWLLIYYREHLGEQ